jgi:putative salt-induced outer membrane protein YdiY
MVQQTIFIFLTIFAITYSSSSDVIILSTGERLELQILNQNDATLQVHHTILGAFTIDSSDITSIEIEKQASTLQKTAPNNPAPESEGASSIWDQSINVGFSLQDGQKDTKSISALYNANKTVNGHISTIDMSYRRAQSDGERTLNRFAGALGNEWFKANSRWNTFSMLQFDWAEFQPWDQRVIGNMGVEYDLINSQKADKKFTLAIRIGSGFRKEFQSFDEEFIPEGLLGASLEWSISNLQTFSANTTWYPDYTDFDNYRLVTNASWDLQLTSIENLAFSIGLMHEYNSVVEVGVDDSSLFLTAGIKYSF